jgi:hypothetical protein
MISFAGTIVLLMIAMMLGKHTPKVRLAAYGLLILIALAQVCIVLIDMLTKTIPTV